MCDGIRNRNGCSRLQSVVPLPRGGAAQVVTEQLFRRTVGAQCPRQHTDEVSKASGSSVRTGEQLNKKDCKERQSSKVAAEIVVVV